MEEKKQNNEQVQSVFATLSAINVNEHTEKKKTGNNTELTYLSWPWAWSEVKKRYPDASYSIYCDEHNRPYIEDPDFGLMCYTKVTINGQTHEMWLPVMNGANKSMKRQSYAYKVWNSFKKQWEDKYVEAASMFDINKTIMRCLVKNLAMFGLGLYIYAGEDLPETEEDDAPHNPKITKKTVKATSQQAIPQMNLSFDDVMKKIAEATTKEQLTAIYNGNKHLQTNTDFLSALTNRKNQILKQNGQTAA